MRGVPCVAFVRSRLLLPLRSSARCHSDRSSPKRPRRNRRPTSRSPSSFRSRCRIRASPPSASSSPTSRSARIAPRSPSTSRGNFFWLTDDGKDIAQKGRSGIDNLARALYLDNPDTEGWDMLAAFAADATADPSPERKGVICAPGEPKYDAPRRGTRRRHRHHVGVLVLPGEGRRRGAFRRAPNSAGHRQARHASGLGASRHCRRPRPCTPRPCGSCCRRDSSDSSLRMRCCRCPAICSATRRTATPGGSPASSAACRRPNDALISARRFSLLIRF